MGVRLPVRSTRRLSPTEAGIAFDERALRAITEANEAEAATQGAGTGLEGQLRMCAPVTFARLHVVPKLGAFLEAHPKLRVELVMDDRPIDLVAEHIDAALRLGALPNAALVARKLTPGERFVVASLAYLAPRGVPRTPAELLAHAAIIDDQSAGSEEWGSANTFRRGSVMAAGKYRTADVDGLKIFYREAGAAEVPNLLLLPGFPSASHMFRDLSIGR